MAVLIRRAMRAAIAAVVCLAGSAATLAAQRTGTAEDVIKAAFLLNFARFVEWPAATATAPFRLCTVAEPAFDAAVDRTIAGESSGGRQLTRVTPESVDAARGCDLLFLSRREGSRAGRWLTAVHSQPVLVVGESAALAEAGAHITFVIEDNRVKFDVNEDAAARAGLKISSKLLRVARRVNGKAEE